jgi:signal peptidase I
MQTDAGSPQATRETVESIVVAIILAFLFRAFVAEAFVIPTGSMAPTLQGRHLDLKCPQCDFRFRAGASVENDSNERVDLARCQICRFPVELDRSPPRSLLKTNRDSFNGDRILVSKFAYQLKRPQRWDVIVFKYPGNAKQNYIKRLIGLPDETILLKGGDVFIADKSQKHLPLREREYAIARKPENKIEAMSQVVDDTDFIGDLLRSAGWPSRWNQESQVADDESWLVGELGNQFAVNAGEEVSWLRYRHLVPWDSDWEYLAEGSLPPRMSSYRGQLITDYYAYNDIGNGNDAFGEFGSCWVGDLAIEADVDVQGATGELLLDLVEGGVHFTCRIDVADGAAMLAIDEGAAGFVNDDGTETQQSTAQTSVTGPGRYQLRFANIDDRLLLWVDGKLVVFDSSTNYGPAEPIVPKWESGDPGDLAPLGIGARNLELHVGRLKVLRDVYYQAVEADRKSEYAIDYQPDMLREIFSNPHRWSTTELFDQRRLVPFELEENQYFPMGDNSPQSKDARLWSEWGTRATGYENPPPHVDGDLMIGKALLIYWPHAWRPFLPNFARMGLIR